MLETLAPQFLDHSLVWGSILRQGLGITSEEPQGFRPLDKPQLPREDVVSSQVGFSEALGSSNP